MGTNVKQSKELLKLGLKPETADLCWDEEVSILKIGNPSEYIDFEHPSKIIPAWSLEALLRLMPKSINEEGTSTVYAFSLFPTWDKTWIAIYETGDHYICEQKEATSPTEAVYEMCIWLLKEGYIK